MCLKILDKRVLVHIKLTRVIKECVDFDRKKDTSYKTYLDANNL